MIDYNYLQDNRDTNTYKAYIQAGIKNQHIAVDQIVKDWWTVGYRLEPRWLDNNIDFQTSIEGITGYKPDVEITFITPYGNRRKRKYEIKVTDHEPSEFIDIKDYQVDFLDKHFSGSFLMYCTPSKYFTLSINEIKHKYTKGYSDKIGGKVCYHIWTPGLMDLWKPFLERPNFVPYPKIK